VYDTRGAARATSTCDDLAATVLLGPSTMADEGLRVLASTAPCIITGGSVVLNLPVNSGLEVIAATVSGTQTTQMVIVPLTRVGPITNGQILFSAVLSETITGEHPTTGDQVTRSGFNAIFLRNDRGEDVEFNADNSVALNLLLRR
jgi:hypothetical protein